MTTPETIRDTYHNIHIRNPLGLAFLGMVEAMHRYTLPDTCPLRITTWGVEGDLPKMISGKIITEITLFDFMQDCAFINDPSREDLFEMARTDSGTGKRGVQIHESPDWGWMEIDLVFFKEGEEQYRYKDVSILAAYAWVPVVNQWIQGDPISTITFPEVITQYGDSNDNFQDARGLNIQLPINKKDLFFPLEGTMDELRDGRGEVCSNKLGRAFRWILEKKNIGTTVWLSLAAAYIQRSVGDIDHTKRTAHVSFSFASDILTWSAFEAAMDIMGVEIEAGLTEADILAGNSKFEVNKLIKIKE
jgi:hypothetical protein